jgi:hypothetical protein
MVCELALTDLEPKPYFAFYDNKTYFSVPDPVAVRIACQQTFNSQITDTSTQTISGVGVIEIKPSCTIILPDNNKYFSNPILEAESLDTSNMMSILKNALPEKYNFSFKVPAPKPIEFLPIPQLKPINTSIIEQIFQEITHPAKALGVTAIFFIIFFSFIIILIFLCICSPCFRTWFHTCTFFKNPKTWWTTYKNYEVPAFNKLAPSNTVINRVKQLTSKISFNGRKIEPKDPLDTIETAPPTRNPDLFQLPTAYEKFSQKLKQELKRDNTPTNTRQHDLYPEVIFAPRERYSNNTENMIYSQVK